eukprot:gene5657-5896_t
MALKVVQTVLKQGTYVSSMDSVEMLFKFIAPLVEEGADDDDMDEEDIEEEQVMVARMLHQLTNPDPSLQFAILRAARAHLELGGSSRLRYTFPSLAFCGLKAIRSFAGPGAAVSGDQGAGDANAGSCEPVTVESALQWLLEVVLQLAEVPAPMQALRLLLACAHVSSQEAGLEMLTYEFFEQAFTLYEESVADSRHKVTALHAIVGTLHRCYVFSSDNRDALTQSVISYSAKLLKRADQCRAACSASHLAWQDDPPAVPAAAAVNGGAGGLVASEAENAEEVEAVPGAANPKQQPPVRDGQKVMVGLKRALKVVAAAKQQRAASARQGKGGAPHLPLYVEIVNHYLYYLARGVEQVSSSVVQQLLELVASELAQHEAEIGADTKAYWDATKQHIQHEKARAAEGTENRFAALTV